MLVAGERRLDVGGRRAVSWGRAREEPASRRCGACGVRGDVGMRLGRRGTEEYWCV